MMDNTTITVGHQPSPNTLNLSTTSWTYDVCDTPDLCARLDAQYGPSPTGPLAHRWVHLTVIRVVVPAAASPACAAAHGVTYEVYLNEDSLGVSPPLCPPPQSGSGGDALYFGMYQPTADAAQRVGFDGYLQEWRLWHGALSLTAVSDLMQMPLRRAREAYTGDPTAGSVRPATYLSSHVLLANYDFDAPCATDGCAVGALAPEYPRGRDARFAAAAVGHVTAASSDSSGAVFWRSAVSDAGSIVSDGRLALSPTGPGLYQVRPD
jgi:hypothetical protein